MNYRGGLKSVRCLDLARQLRHDRTSAEIAMWTILRGRRFMGLKFRRQHPFRDFVFDFYCVELKLAVELDGAPHFLPEIARRDDDRTARLQKLGLTVVRIENQELIQESRVVMERLERLVRALAGNADSGTTSPHPYREYTFPVKKTLLALVVLLVAFLAYQWLTFPDVAALASSQPKETAFMKQRRAQLRAEGKADALERRWVPYSRISPYLRRAVLVAEDDEFYKHEGVDVEGLKEALRKDWENKRLTHGGSTITQQLAKNLYLSRSRNPYRKLKEFFIARQLEDKLSKKRILEIYLNVVEFGERVYGAEAAARHHFGKSASSLTPSEAALLAGSLPNPRIMVASKPNKRLRARQRMILSRMRRWGYLFEQEVLTAKPPKEIPTATPLPPDPDLAPPETETAEPEVPETTTTPEPEPLPEAPLPTETTGTQRF